MELHVNHAATPAIKAASPVPLMEAALCSASIRRRI
jgi:hypothetical protein